MEHTVAPAPVAPSRAPRAGELTSGWQAAVVVAWVAVVVALAAVWGTSRQLGLSTWWLGPVAEPRPVVVSLLPFVAPFAVIVAALLRLRFVPWLQLAGAAALAAIGIADLGRVQGLGVLELAIAGCGALVALASSAGTYRRAPAHGGPGSADPAAR